MFVTRSGGPTQVRPQWPLQSQQPAAPSEVLVTRPHLSDGGFRGAALVTLSVSLQALGPASALWWRLPWGWEGVVGTHEARLVPQGWAAEENCLMVSTGC